MGKELVEEGVGPTYAEEIIHSSSFAVDSNFNQKKSAKCFNYQEKKLTLQ